MNFHNGALLKDHQRRTQHLLNACSRVRTLRAAKILHATALSLCPFTRQTLLVLNNTLFMYASLGEISVARKVFDQMRQRNVVSYNTLIGAYSRWGGKEEAWALFSEMRRDCWFWPTQFTFGGLMSCGSLHICESVQLHALVLKNGLFFSNAFVGTALLSLYGRLGFLDEAVCTFEDVPCKSLVTWNSMLYLLGRHGFVESCVFLFRELVGMGAAFSGWSVVAVLFGFSSEEALESGEQIHGMVVKVGLDNEVTVVNSLINMYAKCAGFCFAEKMFEVVAVRDVVTWNTVIGAVAKCSRPERALQHFSNMCGGEVRPNSTTYVNLINCCTSMGILFHGEAVHMKVIKSGFGSNPCIGSALVDFYAKCDNLDGAHRCFDEVFGRNVVCWNALISGYSNKCSSTSILLFREMLRLGYQPNEFTFSAVLKSAFQLELHQLHCLTIKWGYQDNGFVLSSLITSHARNGLVTDALDFVRVFNSPFLTVPFNISAGICNRTAQYDETLKLLSELDEPDRVSWNIMIEACARNDYYEEVFVLFKQMNLFGIYPDNFTFVSLLSACATNCNLALGSSLHGLIIKMDFNCCDSFVRNALIDMYGKCGSIKCAVKIFDESTDRNLITWTALISALGTNGHAHEALERFREMELLGIKSDTVALNAVLTACRHGSLVREAMELFDQMAHSYGIAPEMQHYQTMVDLLAKTGHTSEAEKIITSMPFRPNPIIWRSFLQGCNRQRTSMVPTNRYTQTMK